MRFGSHSEKGIRLDPSSLSLEVIDAEAHPDEVLVHDPGNRMLAHLLVELEAPVALGVLYQAPATPYEKAWNDARGSGWQRKGSVAEEIARSNTWVVD